MQLVDLKFRPGVDKQDTAYSAGDVTMVNLKDGAAGQIYLTLIEQL
jgi:hypothetical protein